MPQTLREAAKAIPFCLTHVLTDNGSCFTPAFAKACAELGVEYRHTRPLDVYIQPPQTNGMVERRCQVGEVGAKEHLSWRSPHTVPEVPVTSCQVLNAALRT